MINPYEVLSKIFSSDGYATDIVTIKFPDKIGISITQEGNKYFVSFEDYKPVIKLKKYLHLSLKLSGIILGESGGILRIDLFPDVPFKYDWLNK
mgnify:CR=1 FL=1|jgi:hypothetical protein